MDRSTQIILVSKTYSTDAIGQLIPVETNRNVFANIKSVSRSEFFAGGEAGFNPQYVATMFAPDYNGEDTMIYNSTRYTLYRTYRKSGDEIELMFEKRVGT